MESDPPSLAEQVGEDFGRIDIYLFDQILRGRISQGMRVLDAGCGGGRNIRFLMGRGFSVHGIDRDPAAVAEVGRLATDLGCATAGESFRVGDVTELPYADASYDLVISSAVLHFAEDENQFGRMVGELWRVLADGGILWARLASSIGIEEHVSPLGNRRHGLPDGSERFLVDEPYLVEWTDTLGGRLLDPIKTTNVQGQRCMTTWVVGKP